MNELAYYGALFLIISAFDYGHCEIKCYSCSSKDNPSCLNPEGNKLEQKKCNVDQLTETKKYAAEIDVKFSSVFDLALHTSGEPLIPLNCMKQVTRIGKEEYTIRGCQLVTNGNLDICSKVIEKAKMERMNVTYCSLCSTDGCNSSPGFEPAAYIFTLTPAAMFLMKYLG